MPLHQNERDFLGNLYVYGASQKQSLHGKHQYRVYPCNIFLQHLMSFSSCSGIFCLNHYYFVCFRILRLQEAGLLFGEWEKRYVPSASKCMKVNELNGVPRLSLKKVYGYSGPYTSGPNTSGPVLKCMKTRA